MRLLTEQLREKIQEALGKLTKQIVDWERKDLPDFNRSVEIFSELQVTLLEILAIIESRDKETLKAVKEAINDYTHNKISFERLAELLEINLYELDAAFRKRDTETRKVTLMAVGEWLEKNTRTDGLIGYGYDHLIKGIEAFKRGEMPEEVK